MVRATDRKHHLPAGLETPRDLREDIGVNRALDVKERIPAHHAGVSSGELHVFDAGLDPGGIGEARARYAEQLGGLIDADDVVTACEDILGDRPAGPTAQVEDAGRDCEINQKLVDVITLAPEEGRACVVPSAGDAVVRVAVRQTASGTPSKNSTTPVASE
jgi:hypothetical protein